MAVSDSEEVVDEVLEALGRLGGQHGPVAGIDDIGLPMLYRISACNYDLEMLPDATWREVDSRCDVAFFSRDRNGRKFRFTRLRTIKTPRHYPWRRLAAQYHVTTVGLDGGSTSVGATYLSNDGARWQMALRGRLAHVEPGPEVEFLAMAPRMEFTMRYQWKVAMSLDGSPFVGFPADPAGCRELLRARELPAGRARRTALVHWVNSHRRSGRGTDESRKGLIKSYLRGEAECSWNGLRVKVLPSAADLELYQKNHGEGAAQRYQ